MLSVETPTRVTADIAANAAAVAPSESRAFSEQVNYWARIGMQVERSQSLAHRRVLGVAAGDEQFSSLDTTERVTAHALIDARITERAAKEHFGAAARAADRTPIANDTRDALITARLATVSCSGTTPSMTGP